jgi:hypothetical protein
MSAGLVDECYKRACDARRSAELASMPSQKTHFLEVEKRWLRAAATVGPDSSPGGKAIPKKIPFPKRMPIKFTPERIEQIRSLVSEGKSKEEIAGSLGVTVGSLQVTCSKHGISLRRPKFSDGLSLPAQEPAYTGPANPSSVKVHSVHFPFEQVDHLLLGGQPEPAAPRVDHIEYRHGNYANLALTMHLGDRERTVPLRLPTEVISALALESQLRNMTLGELVGEIVAGALASGLPGLLDEPTNRDAA